MQLPDVNPVAAHFIKADAEAGDFELYMELAAADGKFKGYAKPVMRDVNIYSSEEPEKNPLKRLWEGLVDFAARRAREPRDRSGRRARAVQRHDQEPEGELLETIVSVLRNAFVSAFARSLEGSISLRDVKKGLKDIGQEEKEAKQSDRKAE